MKQPIVYNFAQKFSEYPGPRNEDIGPNSGEKFREEVLKQFFSDNQPIILDIEETKTSFGPSFLSEAFGLFAKNIGLETFKELIKIKDTPKNQKFKDKMMMYVRRELDNG